MANDEKFKVRNLHTGRWVRAALVDGDKTFANTRDNARAFEGPAARAYWGALPDYEIVPEPEPFVFPPTPWREGAGQYCVTQDGRDVFPLGPGPAKSAIWAEIRRRVNWHDTAEKALHRINAGEDDGEPYRVAFQALAKLPEPPA